MPFKNDHIGHGYWLHHLSWDISSNRSSPNRAHSPGHRRTGQYSPFFQRPALEVLQDRRNTKPPRIYGLATSLTARTSTHLPRRLQDSLEAYDSPATHHHLDLSELARWLPQHSSATPNQRCDGSITTSGESSQPPEIGYRREIRCPYQSRYEIVDQAHCSARYGHEDAKEATAVIPS